MSKFTEWVLKFKKDLINSGDPYEHHVITLSKEEYDELMDEATIHFFKDLTPSYAALIELLHIDRVIKVHGTWFFFRVKEVEAARKEYHQLKRSIDDKIINPNEK